jgi:hypothetical protein
MPSNHTVQQFRNNKARVPPPSRIRINVPNVLILVDHTKHVIVTGILSLMYDDPHGIDINHPFSIVSLPCIELGSQIVHHTHGALFKQVYATTHIYTTARNPNRYDLSSLLSMLHNNRVLTIFMELTKDDSAKQHRIMNIPSITSFRGLSTRSNSKMYPFKSP